MNLLWKMFVASLILIGCDSKLKSKPGEGALETGASSFSEQLSVTDSGKKTISLEALDSRIKTLRFMLQSQKGIPPESDASVLQAKREKFYQAIQGAISAVRSGLKQIEISRPVLTGEDANALSSLSRNCKRFHSLVGYGLKDLRETEKIHSEAAQGSEDQVLSAARIGILRSFLDQMSYGIEAGTDGGFAGPGLEVQCEFEGRDEVHDQLRLVLKSFGDYWISKNGLDPILSDEVLANLAGMEAASAKRDAIVRGAHLVTMIALSAAFWELAIVRGVTMAGQALQLSTVTMAAARGVLIVGMSTGMAVMDRVILPEDYRVLRPQSSSDWNTLLEQFEDLQESRLRSVDVYAPYILESDRTRLLLLKTFLERRGSDLEKAEKTYGSLENALKYHESLKAGVLP